MRCPNPVVHPELDALFNALLPFAQTMLREHGEFYPFGAIMTSSGEIRQVGAKMEDDDHPPSQPLIDLLTDAFKKQAKKGELRAAGICYDVLTVPPGEVQKRDAVCCCLEHYWASKARHRASAGVCSMVEKKDSKRLKKMKDPLDTGRPC